MKKMLMTLAAVFFTVALLADTWTDPDTGITWTYTIVGDEAQIGTGGSAAISTATSGHVDVPAELGGKPVTAIGVNAFKGCIGLSSINIPDPVASIGESAFEGCTGLSGIDLSASVTSIHKYAFDDCSGLTWIYVDPKNANYKSVNGMLLTKDGTTLVQGINGGVTIPDGVTTIGNSAFSGCGGLWSVTIPASVTTIDQFAFWRCDGLASVTIPDGVTTINSGAFRYCNSLKRLMISQAGVDNFGAFNGYYTDLKVVIADGVTSIPDNAFKNCTGIKSVLIPGSVTTIGESAFEGCTGLECLSICSGVTTIKAYAFQGCKNKLNCVTIPSSVASIGNDAFKDCDSLNYAVVPAAFNTSSEKTRIFGTTSASIFGLDVFVEAVGGIAWTYTESGGEAMVYGGSSYVCAIPKNTAGDIIVPSTLGGYPVTKIDHHAFADCDGITGVTIPYGVTEIKYSAFNDCDGLTSIVIPSSVTDIGNYSFYSCDNLHTAIVPTTCSLGTGVFDYCHPSIKILYINVNVFVTLVDGILWTYTVDGAGNATLGDGYRAPAVPTTTAGALTIPASLDGHPVTSIGSAAFYLCSGLTSVVIPSGVTAIGDYAFQECTGLQEIVVPQSVTACGDYAFADCSHLYEAVMPVVFEPNEYSIFYTSPTSVRYRDVDLEIADGRAWVYTVDDGKATVGGGVYGQALTPAYVTTVGDIAIPSILGGYPVTSIGEEAFYDCDGLTGVDIPSSVAAIGDEAFAYCDGLASVTIVGNGATTIGDEAFYDCDRLTSVMIGNGVATIGYSAFEDCSALESVTIIGNGAMAIADCAFEYCDGLTSVTIGNGVATVGDYAFEDCSALTSMTILEGVTSIGESAFENCTGLATVAIPSTVTFIHPYAFDNCTGLTAFSVADANAVYSSANGLLLSKDGKTVIKGVKGDVKISGGVETIGDSAFYGSGLTSVEIPASVTTIDDYAFGSCALTEIAIPASVTTIGYHAVNGTPLTTIHVGVGDTDRIKGLIEASGTSTVGITFVEDVPPSYTATFDANGGSVSPATRLVTSGAAVGDLPTATRDGYTLVGWFTLAEGGEQVTAATVVTADVTFFAQWKKNTFTATFDANGGSVSPATRLVANGAAVGELPTATLDGYTLVGWFTAAEGGEQVTAATVVTADVTFFAQWTPNAIDPESLDPFYPGVLPCYEVLNPADIWNPIQAPKATTLMGAAYYGCDVVGIVELKVGKPSKDMYAKVSGTVILLDGKKYTIKSQKCYFGGSLATTLNLEVKGGGNLMIAIGSIGGVNVFSGELGKWHVQTANVGGNWNKSTATVKVDMSDALDSLPSGILSELLPTNEVGAVSGGKWKFKKAAGVKYTKPKAGQSTLTPIDAAGKGLVVDTSKDKTNLSGLKLTYTMKKGTFKGSFKMYVLNGGKLTKCTVNVSGVVVNGIGYGIAICKKPFVSWFVIVE